MEKPKPSNDDYGFSYDPELVAELYWAMSNDGAALPEAGGLLDQDKMLKDDLAVFGWLRGIAEGILDKNQRAIEQGKKNLDRMSPL